MTQSTYDLVIFDCDGVLVDSEPIANRVFAEMLGELGLHTSIEDMYANFVGHPMTYCMQLVEQRLGRAPPVDFEARLQERTFAAFESDGLKGMSGVIEALDQIAIPACVASSGELDKMKFTLGLTGLLPRFRDRLFSVTQVKRGKPAPDIYLYAAARMGVRPEKCVVVEDSPIGAQSGVAAGMSVLGFCAHTPAEKLIAVGVQRTFAEMRELPSILAEGGGR